VNNFKGFSRETLDFLIDLGKNNNRTWFKENKNKYKKYVLEPLQNLVMDLSGFMLTIDPLFETRPLIDKTISRIYRDIRFSRNKTPYRNNVWITFKRLSKDWKESPVYFFEFSPDTYHYGMGFYSASKTFMDSFRKRVDEYPDEFLKVTSFYRNSGIFELKGDKYKRTLNKTKPAEILEWYQRKSFYLVSDNKISNEFFSSSIIDKLIYGFQLIAPLYQYLWMIKSGILD